MLCRLPSFGSGTSWAEQSGSLETLPVNWWPLLSRWLLPRNCSLLRDLNLERKGVTDSLFADVVSKHRAVQQKKEPFCPPGPLLEALEKACSLLVLTS